MSKFELVVAVANAGFSEVIMSAAREAGAHGGTITHARGTSTKSSEKKFGVYVTPDKEMMLIVVNTNIRDNVLSAIYKATGPDNPGKCVAFSLPVDNTVGIKYSDEINSEEKEKNVEEIK